MKIVLFGSNGMLGSYIKAYLKDKWQVMPLTRADLDLSRSDKEEIFSFLNNNIDRDDIIVNAAGLINQRHPSAIDSVKVNSVFPQILADFKIKKGCEVLHITTDCVFNGIEGSYTETDYHNCSDIYGITKSLGENCLNTNIRTSIIGEELNNKLSLLEWVLSMDGKVIDGYKDHIWNGVTCLELSKVISSIVENNKFWQGTRHIHSLNKVSKFDLINQIIEVYDLNIVVNKTKSKKSCYRDLCSNQPPIVEKDIRRQLVEMRQFNIKKRI